MTVTIGKTSDSVLGAVHIAVDRTYIFGNPFPLQSESQRDEVCDKYEVWFYEQLEASVNFRTSLQRFKTMHNRGVHLHLMCHCAPKRCHAETIKRYIES